MPQRLAKTRKHRSLKTKKMGAVSKARREIHGTTARLPLSGEMPTLRGGRPVDAIEIPTELLAKLTKKKSAPATKKAAKA